MITVEQALEKAAKYEALGKHKTADIYLRIALRMEDDKVEPSELLALHGAIQSAQRSVTGSIHR